MTKDEANRKIAEWLGLIKEWPPDQAMYRGEQYGYIHDFYFSEEASALVLEKMRRPLLVSDWPRCEGWRVDIGVEKAGGKPLGPTHNDRKTAIAEAALKMIEVQSK